MTAALLLGATVAGASLVLLGNLLASRPSRTAERRLDRVLAVEAARADRLLALVLARPGTAELGHLLATAPAQPPPPPSAAATGGQAAPPPDPWEQAMAGYVADPHELTEQDEFDDAAVRRAGLG
jgi:hypothetical protein